MMVDGQVKDVWGQVVLEKLRKGGEGQNSLTTTSNKTGVQIDYVLLSPVDPERASSPRCDVARRDDDASTSVDSSRNHRQFG